MGSPIPRDAPTGAENFSMRRSTFTMLLILALAPPLAASLHAHPAGAPRTWCEDLSWDNSHEYGPSTGFLLVGASDGSTPEACAGSLGSLADGHDEYALGGALLTAAYRPGCNDGLPVDHPEFPTVEVTDFGLEELDQPVAFSVYVDTLNNVPPLDPAAPNCGDFEADYGMDCLNVCAVPFPPGLDGAYQVRVSGTSGIISTAMDRAPRWTYAGCSTAPDGRSHAQIWIHDPWWGRPHEHVYVSDGPCPPQQA